MWPRFRNRTRRMKKPSRRWLMGGTSFLAQGHCWLFLSFPTWAIFTLIPLTDVNYFISFQHIFKSESNYCKRRLYTAGVFLIKCIVRLLFEYFNFTSVFVPPLCYDFQFSKSKYLKVLSGFTRQTCCDILHYQVILWHCCCYCGILLPLAAIMLFLFGGISFRTWPNYQTYLFLFTFWDFHCVLWAVGCRDGKHPLYGVPSLKMYPNQHKTHDSFKSKFRPLPPVPWASRVWPIRPGQSDKARRLCTQAAHPTSRVHKVQRQLVTRAYINAR